MSEEMSKEVVKIKYPVTNSLNMGEEIIKSYGKISEENIEKSKEIQKNISQPIIPEKVKNKIVKTFKAVLAGGMIGGVVTPLAACKEAPGVEEQVVEEKEEEKGEVTIPSEKKEETKEIQETAVSTETTAEEKVPPTTEIITQAVEYRGVIFTLPEWSGANPQTGEILALAGNPYGVEAGIKIGQCVEDGAEINGEMKPFIGLKPEVIEVIQKERMKEDKEFVYPFFIDLESVKGVKIEEEKDTDMDDQLKSYDLFWDNTSNLRVSDLPVGTKIYSPVETSYFLIWDNNCGRENVGITGYILHFGIYRSEFQEDLMYKNERFDVADLWIDAIGFNLLPSGMERNVIEQENGGYYFLTETKIGKPVAEVVSEEHGTTASGCVIRQLKDKDSKPELYEILGPDMSKVLTIGLAGLLKIEEIPVFINP